MRALLVDDEAPMLKSLARAVNMSPDIEAASEFAGCQAALDWAKDNAVDIAFLDINMRGMGGLALAEKLTELQPECKIVFCTGYSEYAVEAFRIHVSGYLLKPITAEAVQKEIDHIREVSGITSDRKIISVKCFGNFEVYGNKGPLIFKRTKTKELMAFLVDRNGAGVNTRQICANLWEDNSDDYRNLNYLYQLFKDLADTLKSVGAENILIKNNNTYSLDTSMIECDYYDYLKYGKPEFHGEYMVQYSWAENTCALL